MFNTLKDKWNPTKKSQKELHETEMLKEQPLVGFSIAKEVAKNVTVVVPNYNYANYLEERITSIFQQTYPIAELLILDDHSSDNSMEVIRTLVERYANTGVDIRVLRNEKNSGRVFQQWKQGFAQASGEYIWIAEADDDCSPLFLEKLMEGFEDERVVLAYAQSKRINEDRTLSEDYRDWTRMISENRWNQSYHMDGITEIEEALSITNTIPNVSAVVFKAFDASCMDAIAERFTLSGDWYLYIQRLLQGDIYYCCEPLNYFRKHSGSVSTDIKKDLELKEMMSIHQEIAQQLALDEKQRNRQRRRYRDILGDVSDHLKQEIFDAIPCKAAWIVPKFTQGGGGARTILQNANYLALHGWLSDLYIDGAQGEDATSITNELKQYFEECFCNVYIGCDLRHAYDVVLATYSIHTPEIAYYADVKHKVYFVQDFEPWFEAMGDAYLQRERGYAYGLHGISIGRWLTYKLQKEYAMPMSSFPFCADQTIYRRLPEVRRERAICFIYQPEKPRRCAKLGLEALHIVKRLRPDVKLYLYGTNEPCTPGFEVEHLQLISTQECNLLYNRCVAGLCISASNPSRIPFEMMAAGLPVVDIYRENNLYDYPDEGILLARNGADALATALIQLLDDEALQQQMSQAGEAFMQQYPIEAGFAQFLSFMNDKLQKTTIAEPMIERWYQKQAILASEEARAVQKQIYEEEANRQNLFVQILDQDLGTFELRAHGLLESGALVSVRVPVWCALDQSDILWYELQRDEQGDFSVKGDIMNHQGHHGTYKAHLYIYLTVEQGTFIEQKSFHI